MANEFIARKGLLSLNNSAVCGSLTVSTCIVATGGICGVASSAVTATTATTATSATSAATWTTGRTLTIGNTGKSVNGSESVAWSLNEIGAAPVFRNTISVSNTVFTNIATITGNSLASAVTITLQGTSGNTVVNVKADILVNHFQDTQVTTTSGNYSQLEFRIISNDNETFSIEARVINSPQSTDLNIEIFPLNNESVTFGGTLQTGTTLTFNTEPGVLVIGTDGTTTTGRLQSGNLRLNVNTISSENTNGHIILSPNGAGNVGIGTTSPAALLNVGATGTLHFTESGIGSMLLKGASGTARGMLEVHNGDSSSIVLLQAYTGGAGVGTLSNTTLDIVTNSTTRMVITGGGCVGIGTTNPGCTLSVVGSICSSGQLRAGTIASVGNIDIGGEIIPTNSCLLVRTAGTIRACIDSVGICTPGILRAANICALTSICGPMVCVSGEVSGLTVRGAHKAADGTSGINQNVSFVDASAYTHTFEFKNGLLVSYSVT
jgi:hypothetical protein